MWKHALTAQSTQCFRRVLFLCYLLQTSAKAKWWLQDPLNRFYQAAGAAIQKHWGVPPNFVCEGGTLRVTPFLEEVM